MSSPDRILATYRITASESESRVRAQALAVEQSVEMPLAAIGDERVLKEVVATVEEIRPRADEFDVVLGIAPGTTGNEASQVMNMLFGNCSLQPEVQLIDMRFPPGIENVFPGPRFGIDGIRTLTGVRHRPLTCSALKPQGSSVEYLAHLARTFALAGIDVINDDHGIANQACHPFAERVPAVQKAITEANRETGGNTIYAPTFSGGSRSLMVQAKIPGTRDPHGIGRADARGHSGIRRDAGRSRYCVDGASGVRGQQSDRRARAARQALPLRRRRDDLSQP